MLCYFLFSYAAEVSKNCQNWELSNKSPALLYFVNSTVMWQTHQQWVQVCK